MSKAIERAVEKFIQLRDKKKEITDGHKEELKPLNEAMIAIENAVQRILIDQGASNIKTPHGTAYLSTTTRPIVEDWSKLKPFILKNDLLDMLVRKVSPDAVTEFKESTGELPPGVVTNSETYCRFKR